MQQIALHLGPVTLHWYGVLVAVGFLAGLWTASRRGVRYGLEPEKMMDLGPWIILGTVLGARTLHVVSYWKESYAREPWTEIFAVWHGGLVFYGGLIGAITVTLFYLLWKRQSIWQYADALAPSIALGAVFGRVGCLMNGCCYGLPTDLPWGIHFPASHDTHGMAVHPVQLYDSLLNLILYATLAWLYRRKRFNGEIFALYLIGYAVLRSTAELFRGDYTPTEFIGRLTPGQSVSVVILLAGLVLFWTLRRQIPANRGHS